MYECRDMFLYLYVYGTHALYLSPQVSQNQRLFHICQVISWSVLMSSKFKVIDAAPFVFTARDYSTGT